LNNSGSVSKLVRPVLVVTGQSRYTLEHHSTPSEAVSVHQTIPESSSGDKAVTVYFTQS